MKTHRHIVLYSPLLKGVDVNIFKSLNRVLNHQLKKYIQNALF